MDKRVIAWLATAIVAALLGLMLVQAQWVRNIVDMKEVELQQSVRRALVAVSERLERMETLEAISRESGDSGLLERIAEVQGKAALYDEDLRALIPPPGKIGGDQELQAAQERLLEEVLRGVLLAGRFADIQQRLDPVLLDSLVADELARQGVHSTWAYVVVNEAGQAERWSEGGERYAAQLLAPEIGGVRLFRHDPFSDPHWLRLYLPDGQRMVLRRIWPMLIASGLFVLLIGLAFVYTLRTIWRQKQLNEIRNDLVNNLTHELKTPISTIALACEALNDPGIPKEPEHMRQFTGMIRDENKRLGLLVESVLQSAVVDSGRMRLRRSEVDMHQMLADVVRNSAIQAENRGGSIRLEPAAELADISGDRVHLTNVFYNLIDNAVKYCEREPRVVVRTASDDTHLSIAVQDNGIGIPKADHKKIFERLYRVPTGNVHNVKGFGLGLSYVRSVVERHGGTIRVESEPGSGSTFIIFLPFEDGRSDQTAVV